MQKRKFKVGNRFVETGDYDDGTVGNFWLVFELSQHVVKRRNHVEQHDDLNNTSYSFLPERGLNSCSYWDEGQKS
jgi:hypothetical protein